MAEGLCPVGKETQGHKEPREHPRQTKGKTTHTGGIGRPKRRQIHQKSPGKTEQPTQENRCGEGCPLADPVWHSNIKQECIDHHDRDAAQAKSDQRPPQIDKEPVTKVAQWLQKIGRDLTATDRAHEIIPTKDTQIGDHRLAQSGVGDGILEIHPDDLGAGTIKRHHHRDSQQTKEDIRGQPRDRGRLDRSVGVEKNVWSTPRKGADR